MNQTGMVAHRESINSHMRRNQIIGEQDISITEKIVSRYLSTRTRKNKKQRRLY